MTEFDYGLIIIFTVSFVISYFSGFIKQIISLFKWIIAFGLAKLFYLDISSVLLQHTHGSVEKLFFTLSKYTHGYANVYHVLNINSVANGISFILIFVVTFIVAAILGKLLTKLLYLTGLGIINSFFGGILGLLKTAVLLSSILIPLTNFIKVDFIMNSFSYPYLKDLNQVLLPILPKFNISQHTKMFNNIRR